MPTALTAHLVIPVAGEPIDDGVVVIDGGRIVQVGRGIPSGGDVVDLNAENDLTSGGVAILPGLVNAHTHLEFSDLESPLGASGMRFPDWIRALIEHRRSRETDPFGVLQDRKPAVLQGCVESLFSGVTAIGEIAMSHWPWDMLSGDTVELREHGPDMTLFYEVLGLADDRADAVVSDFISVQRRIAGVASRWRMGVSPHAPYSTHWKVVEAACNFSRDQRATLAMHLAESPEELELLQMHGGPFHELLNELDVWNADGIPCGSRPLVYLELLASAHRSLVIHGNFLNDDEIAFLAANADRMSVVYCPRTHAYFEHEPYPLSKMLAAGVNVALGTDSRASNPDLNLLAEMRHVAAAHPDVSPSDIFCIGTTNGSRALGIDNETGTLEPGKRADFAVIALPEHDTRDPYESLLRSDQPVVATYVGGEAV